MKVYEFVDPRTTPFEEPRSRSELPHLYKEGGTYFVTFRLWDAVAPCPKETHAQPGPLHHNSLSACGASVPPASAERSVSAEKRNPKEIAASSEPPLRLGSCLLAQPAIAELVQSALRHFDGQRYRLLAWCVMPNHVHVVLQPLGDHSPSDVLHSWKSFTAHKINGTLGRTGPLWERESFDHLARSIESLELFIAYVEANPVEAGLCKSASDWPWSSAWFKRLKSCGAGVPPALDVDAAGTAAPQHHNPETPTGIVPAAGGE